MRETCSKCGKKFCDQEPVITYYGTDTTIHYFCGGLVKKKLEVDSNTAAETLIRDLAEKFHVIISSQQADKFIREWRGRMDIPVYESLTSRCLTPEEISRISAEGFEICARLLKEMGAPDVHITEHYTKEKSDGAEN